MMPKSCTGPTRLAMSEPKPITSVAIDPTTGQNRIEMVRSSAAAGGRPSSRCRRYSTIPCTTVAIATTVTIAESMVETIVSLRPITASTPRVLQSARSTTASGTMSQRRLRKEASRTAPARTALAVPRRLPSRFSIANPSRSITGSPATVPAGRSAIAARRRSIASARKSASGRGAACVDVSRDATAGDFSTQTTAAVRWSVPTAYPSRSSTSLRDAGLVSISMMRLPSGVSARLVAEAMPGSAASVSVSVRSRSIPAVVKCSGSS